MDIAELNRRRLAYKTVFDSDEGRIVLEDMAHFCFVNRSSYVPGDVHSVCFGEGRREVYLRIQEHLRLTEDQLIKLATQTYGDDE